jgi:Protein SET DOMAIN GROUP 2 C-terminal
MSHNFLERNALLLRAAAEELTGEDRRLLDTHGLRGSALCGHPSGAMPLPKWVVKWAALVLRFILEERARLPGLLTGRRKADDDDDGAAWPNRKMRAFWGDFWRLPAAPRRLRCSSGGSCGPVVCSLWALGCNGSVGWSACDAPLSDRQTRTTEQAWQRRRLSECAHRRDPMSCMVRRAARAFGYMFPAGTEEVPGGLARFQDTTQRSAWPIVPALFGGSLARRWILWKLAMT